MSSQSKGQHQGREQLAGKKSEALLRTDSTDGLLSCRCDLRGTHDLSGGQSPFREQGRRRLRGKFAPERFLGFRLQVRKSHSPPRRGRLARRGCRYGAAAQHDGKPASAARGRRTLTRSVFLNKEEKASVAPIEAHANRVQRPLYSRHRGQAECPRRQPSDRRRVPPRIAPPEFAFRHPRAR